MAKISKKVAIATAALLIIGSSSAYAAKQIGLGSVVGDATFNSPIMWDETFPVSAEGVVTGVKVKAKVEPILNMQISAKEINLGVLSTATATTGALNVEVGTNAKSGATVTVQSGNGGLKSTATGAIINNTTATDGVAESYKFISALGGATDSSASGFTAAAVLNTEVTDNTTEHTLYASNKPQSSTNVDDVLFTVSSQIDEETAAADDYEDILTFTATGNF